MSKDPSFIFDDSLARRSLSFLLTEDVSVSPGSLALIKKSRRDLGSTKSSSTILARDLTSAIISGFKSRKDSPVSGVRDSVIDYLQKVGVIVEGDDRRQLSQEEALFVAKWKRIAGLEKEC